jgi:hypothetical protein
VMQRNNYRLLKDHDHVDYDKAAPRSNTEVWMETNQNEWATYWLSTLEFAPNGRTITESRILVSVSRWNGEAILNRFPSVKYFLVRAFLTFKSALKALFGCRDVERSHRAKDCEEYGQSSSWDIIAEWRCSKAMF